MAIAFALVPDAHWRLGLLAAAAATDLLDGPLARRYGSSALGAVVDPIADKLFMASAFGVVLFSGLLAWYEVVGVLLRDLVASAAFFATLARQRPSAIPARLGGKAVTVGQVLTLGAFLVYRPVLHPLAWATTGAAIYAIWDYAHVAARERRPVKL